MIRFRTQSLHNGQTSHWYCDNCQADVQKEDIKPHKCCAIRYKYDPGHKVPSTDLLPG